MCFLKSKQSKVLRAKRDIIVYKIGCFADKVRFYPYFRTTYMYRKETPVYECVEFNKNSIDIGLHSLLSLQGVYNVSDANMLFLSDENMLFLSDENMFPFITINILYNNVYVGKFIIPKGSTYIVNSYNEVVSDTLIYTGKFKHINKNENFNVKDLWKEN